MYLAPYDDGLTLHLDLDLLNIVDSYAFVPLPKNRSIIIISHWTYVYLLKYSLPAPEGCRLFVLLLEAGALAALPVRWP